MNCFMGYNPLVAKEVKITTWIKEFDGESPVYPSFPNDGDCFVVFATDEDALTHNALSKKTYTNGDWADAESGGGGGGGENFHVANVTLTGDGGDLIIYCPKTGDVGYECILVDDNGLFVEEVYATNGNTVTVPLYYAGEYAEATLYSVITSMTGSATENPDIPGNYIITGDCSFTGYYDD